jgi:tight adherence protein C
VLIGHLDDRVRESAVLFSLIGIALFTLQPGMWLSDTIKRRQKSIQRAMPFMIDLLTLSVEAGVDFMNALQRSLESRKPDPLTEELLRVNHEIQLGTPRREALKNLAKRVDMPDMRSFAYALVQADELGVSIGSILRIQADQIRQKRFERAEKLANEAPVKMLGPLMLFIFPAVFIVLLGPILSRVTSGM